MLSSAGDAMSVLTDVAAKTDTEERTVPLPGAGTVTQLCQPNVNRIGVGFCVPGPNSAVLRMDGSQVTGTGISLNNGVFRYFDIKTHGPLCQAAWYETDASSPNQVYVVEVLLNKE